MKDARLNLAAALLLVLGGCAEPETPNRALGYVEADWIYVAAPQSGWIVEQPVAEGDRVEVNDLLFKLEDDAESLDVDQAKARVRQTAAMLNNLETGAREPELRALEAQLREAQAKAALARVELGRIKPLVSRGLEPSLALDRASAEHDAAEAAVDRLRQQINVAQLAARNALQLAASAEYDAAVAAEESAEYRRSQKTVRARREGSVEQLFLRRGEFATAGKPVLSILPDGGMKVRFFVHEAKLASIKVGDVVRIESDGVESASAIVRFIASEAEFTPPVIYSKEARRKLVFMVEASLPEKTGLHAGLPVEVSW